jgi:excinuclease ABC subunit B
MAHCIAHFGRPTLVISHNKTLAAQLYGEFKEFFPENAVEYFVSYYDYYQPEAYIPQRDIYIEKDASINEEIDRLRLSATSSILSRDDVVIIASVSCIYGLGDPGDYERMLVRVKRDDVIERSDLLLNLVDIHYDRNDMDFAPKVFQVRGDVVDVNVPYEDSAFSIELFGRTIERIRRIHPISRECLEELDELIIYPAKHYVVPEERIHRARGSILVELKERLKELRSQGKLLEAQRLDARTRYDVEMLVEVGYCPGIENYSRHISGRAPGERPYTLIDYFKDDFLVIVDESHVTIPQLRGMYNGDRSRKETLVEHGFRLPSALDNRPMRFDEWEEAVDTVMFVSATPGPYELERCEDRMVEQIIRPTGLVDPQVHVRPARDQVPSLMKEVRKRVERKERVLVTTLTKSFAEDLSRYLEEDGFKCTYLHSEIDTLDRVRILKDLRMGNFDVLVGVNLLREGLDLPEVSLVIILDADKEGFLRSDTSLIQTIGRTARNVNAEVILYADEVTDSMQRAIDETRRRRDIQLEHNRKHNISPKTIRKAIRDNIADEVSRSEIPMLSVRESEVEYVTREQMREMEEEMYAAADELDFERAAELRDRIMELRDDDEGS